MSTPSRITYTQEAQALLRCLSEVILEPNDQKTYREIKDFLERPRPARRSKDGRLLIHRHLPFRFVFRLRLLARRYIAQEYIPARAYQWPKRYEDPKFYQRLAAQKRKEQKLLLKIRAWRGGLSMSATDALARPGTARRIE